MTQQQFMDGFGVLFLPIPWSGCWIWMLSVNTQGYGKVHIEGRSKRAHRASYETFVQKIPEGMNVCHTCDCPACVNPDHLFVGTMKENMNDCKSKLRQCIGERNRNSTLTKKEVIEIRALIVAGTKQKDIARAYGIQEPAVSKIKYGQRWGWLKETT